MAEVLAAAEGLAQMAYYGYLGVKTACGAIDWLRQHGYLKNKAANDLKNTVRQQGGIDSDKITKRIYRCSNCGKTGHNKLTCPESDSDSDDDYSYF